MWVDTHLRFLALFFQILFISDKFFFFSVEICEINQINKPDLFPPQQQLYGSPQQLLQVPSFISCPDFAPSIYTTSSPGRFSPQSLFSVRFCIPPAVISIRPAL
jgi:hypothetical protein